MYQPSKLWLTVALILAASAAASAGPLTFTVDDLGGGVFQYNFTLSNSFSEPISGLNLLHGNSAFGLDEASVIGAPEGWDFLAPLPSFVDELNYFSLSSVFDIPIGESRGGFFFQSTRDPDTLRPADLAFDVIGGISGRQLVPEPSAGLLLASACVSLFGCRRYRGKAGATPRGERRPG
jgi:hypothetical protein